MNLESIQEMWGRDSVIDDVMLDQASLKIPQLHSKYLTLLNEFKLLRKKTEQQLKTLTHNKWLYYSGKATPDVYESEPFEHKVMKGDIPRWIEVDEQIHTMEMKLEYYDTILTTLTEILKQVGQMTYHIKQIIDWRRFVNGV